MFFCLPILCGCQQNLKPEGDPTARICPNCHNASVFSAKKTEWFTLFFVPLVPFSSKHVWLCHICRWIAPHAPGSVSVCQPAHPLPFPSCVAHTCSLFSQWEPAIAHAHGGPSPMQPSYQPGYVNQVQPIVNSYQPVYIQSAAQK
ncbi:hypothetical protein C8F01DRAFT_14739 [Mycena amicta]|nr:hypothetical protein C8F01DRAFT_14739 [Mycena amicta]